MSWTQRGGEVSLYLSYKGQLLRITFIFEPKFHTCQLSEMECHSNSILAPIQMYLRTDGRSECVVILPDAGMAWSLSRDIMYFHSLSWQDCEHAKNFRRINIHFVEVLPFKMTPMKPPISVVKIESYVLEGFPRNTSQQLETVKCLDFYVSLFGGVHICTAEQLSDDLSEL